MAVIKLYLLYFFIRFRSFWSNNNKVELFESIGEQICLENNLKLLLFSNIDIYYVKLLIIEKYYKWIVFNLCVSEYKHN